MSPSTNYGSVEWAVNPSPDSIICHIFLTIILAILPSPTLVYYAISKMAYYANGNIPVDLLSADSLCAYFFLSIF